ncbi:tetratricopeptide repeat protein [Candidatus Latescibacterota bacterium]
MLRFVPLLLLVAITPALGSLAELHWKEYVRLSAVTGGLVYLRFRYGRSLRLSYANTRVAGKQPSVGGTELLALVCVYLLTQLEPGFGVAPRDAAPAVPLHYISFVAIALAFGAHVAGLTKLGMPLFRFTLADKVVVACVCAIVGLSVGTRVVFSPGELALQDLTGPANLLACLCLWLVAVRPVILTRADGTGLSHGAAGDMRLDRAWRVLRVGILLILAMGTAIGAGRMVRSYGLYRRAIGLAGAGDFGGSAACLDAWRAAAADLQLEPGPWLKGAAQVYAAAGRHRDFQAMLERYKERAGNDGAKVLRDVGSVALASSQWSDAIRAYEGYLVQAGGLSDPQDTVALHGLAQAYLEDGRPKSVVELVRRYANWPSVTPDGAVQAAQLGVACMQLKQWDRAARWLREATQASPDEARYQYLLGRIYLSQGDVEKARAVLRGAAELRPDWADIHYQLGICCEELDLHDEAILRFRTACELLPGHLDAWLGQQRLERDATALQQIAVALEGLLPDVRVGRNVGDELFLIGYDLPPVNERERGALEITLYWRLNPDTLATPAREHFLARQQAQDGSTTELVVNEGPVFRRMPADWELGEVVRSERRLPTLTGSTYMGTQHCELLLNVLYDMRDAPSDLLFSWATSTWVYSPTLVLELSGR